MSFFIEKKHENVIGLCKLEDLLNRHPFDLSGGEKQRGALAKVLLLNPDILETYLVDNGILGHDIYNLISSENIDAVDYASSSLGHGLSVGAGMALANPNRNVYVLIGDGELQEGSMWEALFFIKQHKLKNLTVICDRNYMQIDGFTKDIIDTSSNIEKMAESLGFDVLLCNGHDIDAIKECLNKVHNRPKFIIAGTIKGHGMEFMLDEVGAAMFHHGIFDEKQKNRILEVINDQ